MEQFANRAEGLLNTALANNGTTTDVVLQGGNGTAFPSTGDFRFYIDNEIFVAQGRSGDTLQSCLRAQEGTSFAAHNAGALVVHAATAEAFRQAILGQIYIWGVE